MLRKESEIRWTIETKKSFDEVKQALASAPILASPDYTKDFIVFYFTSEHTIVVVLMQKNQQGAFFSKVLRDSFLKYNMMEKQAYTLVKALKYFRVYVLHSHVISYILNVVVKDILTQLDPEGRRGRWIVAILEYDVEINPTRLIKGQGMAKLMADSNMSVLDINFIASLSDDNNSKPSQ